ncbi:MAG: DNA repair protein RecN [Corallococcus sp.]|nr:DNA repair protein RecN [Corallococcus sp.]
MIRKLEINNIALISSLSLEFADGLTVLSGETGSGKSIIIDSLAFVLGDRADKAMIKYGENKAWVEVVFEIDENASTRVALENLGFDAESTLVISRYMTLNGKNECRVNGRLCTASMLKQITSTLVDIFGQSQHINLLRSDNHLSILDGFCDFGKLKSDLQIKYKSYTEIKKQLKTFGEDPFERERQLDVLKFQIAELTDAAVSVEEEEELLAVRKRMMNAERIASALTSTSECINGYEHSIISNLSRIRSVLQSIDSFGKDISDLYARVESSLIELQDIAATVEGMLDNTNYDSFESDRVERRLDTIRQIKRKYGAGDIDKALEYLEEAKKRYEALSNASETVELLTAQKQNVIAEMYRISVEISKIRKKTAAEFCNKVCGQLSDLGMSGAKFDIRFAEEPDEKLFEKTLSPNGYDEIEFMFSANTGEPIKPLAKVISGGEMSRFMLAIKNVTATVENIPTMIYDEIDTGISGKVASMVAMKLGNVSRDYQCIVITHLPQIASMADSNLLIEKYEEAGRTVSTVRVLADNDSKTAEIARLMGGIGEHSAMNAAEMISWANEYKKQH